MMFFVWILTGRDEITKKFEQTDAKNADELESNELVDVTWGDLSDDPMETVNKPV